MPLSSSSIIHFAEEKESLRGILEDNFHVHYCAEDFYLGSFRFQVKVPMVSFCDIPLSQIKEHIGNYGPYGIGLTKEWAARNQLNPVLYIEPNSTLACNLKTTFREFIGKSDKRTEHHYALADVLRYVKNYQGDLTRKGVTYPDYRYSDEREWRFVPPRDDSHLMVMSINEYESDPEMHDASLDTLRLTFEPNDIKYVIINNDDEINEFVEHLRSVKGKRYTYQDIERLMTRILTTEQIMSDI